MYDALLVPLLRVACDVGYKVCYGVMCNALDAYERPELREEMGTPRL